MSRGRFITALRNDLRLQWRYGFWVAYALVVITYLLVLELFPASWGVRDLLIELVVFSDPSVLGFFFVGGLMLLERGEHTLQGCFASPLAVDEWLAAKATSLTLIALLASFAIAWPLVGAALRPGLLMLAVVPTSTCFVLIGVVIGTRCSTVNRYLFGGALVTFPLMIPMVAVFGLFDSLVFDLLPSGAALDLLEAALGRSGITPVAAFGRTAVLIGWTALSFVWARAWMRDHVLGGAPEASAPEEARS
jgi:fluoroquinolone transport system permease protein